MKGSWIKIFFLLCVFFIVPLQKTIAGTLLVANTISSSVSLFDESTLKRIKEIPVGYMPHEVAVTPNGKLALVSNFGDQVNIIAGSSVTVIDIVNAKVMQTIKLPKRSRPHGLMILSDTEALVTAQGIQSLLLINYDKPGQVLKTLPLPGAGAHMVTVDKAHRYAYVTNTDSGSVSKVDLKSWSVIGETKIGKQCEGIMLTEDENLLLATDSKDHYVAVIRTKDLVFLRTILTDLGPVRVVSADGGKSAVVINSVSGTVQIIDLVSFTISKTIPSKFLGILFTPANIFVREDEVTVYISNILANTVVLVDFKQNTVLKTLQTSLQPNGLAISPQIAGHK